METIVCTPFKIYHCGSKYLPSMCRTLELFIQIFYRNGCDIIYGTPQCFMYLYNFFLEIHYILKVVNTYKKTIRMKCI